MVKAFFCTRSYSPDNGRSVTTTRREGGKERERGRGGRGERERVSERHNNYYYYH